MTRSTCGRADLVRVLAARGPALLDIAARMLGYEPAAPPPAAPVMTAPVAVARAEPPAEDFTVQAVPLVDMPCWQLTAHEILVADLPPPAPLPEECAPALALPPPEFHPLCSWQALLPRLRRAATEQAERRELDVDALIDRLSTGRAIERLPRKTRWRWGDRVQVIADRSHHLVPYWHDQDLVLAALRQLYPRHAFQTALIHEGLPEPVLLRHQGGKRRYRLPAAKARFTQALICRNWASRSG